MYGCNTRKKRLCSDKNCAICHDRRLSTVPDIDVYWDYEMNKDVDINTITRGNTRVKFWFKCGGCARTYQCAPANFLKRTKKGRNSCSKCKINVYESVMIEEINTYIDRLQLCIRPIGRYKINDLISMTTDELKDIAQSYFPNIGTLHHLDYIILCLYPHPLTLMKIKGS